MPQNMKADLVDENILNIINKFMIFDQLDIQDLKQILGLQTLSGNGEVAVIKKYTQGEIIIREGDYGSCTFWLVKGMFDVVEDGIHIATINTPGEVFGEMSIFEKIPRVATVTAVTDSICLSLDMSVIEKPNNKRVESIIKQEFNTIMLERLESTKLWLEDEKRRIEEKYTALLESKKKFETRLREN